MQIERAWKTVTLAMGAVALSAASAKAHPHVFAEAHLQIVVADGAVEALRHVWHFDDLFSSTVLFEFDENRDLELDEEELTEVGSVIHESLAEFGYFQFVTRDGHDVDMAAPERIMATFENQQLTISFESVPSEPLELAGNLHFGVYDPTFYTAIDFVEDADIAVADMPDICAREVVRPDPDEAIAANQQTLTEAFFADPASNDLSKLFATRLEIACEAQG